MKKMHLVILAVIMVLSLMSIPACAEQSEDEVVADGVFCYLPRPRDASSDFLKVADHNYYSAESDVGEWTGVFTGTSEDYGMTISHSEGRVIFIGTVLFDTVDVDGTSGGLEMYLTGEKPDKVSDWEGSWLITSGTGALEDIQGHGSWWGPGWQGNFSDCGVLNYSVEDLDDLDL
jgi:hypothetical protein